VGRYGHVEADRKYGSGERETKAEKTAALLRARKIV
jgi:hypothetical protein